MGNFFDNLSLRLPRWFTTPEIIFDSNPVETQRQIQQLPNSYQNNPPSPLRNSLLRLFTPQNTLPHVIRPLTSRHNIPYAAFAFGAAAGLTTLFLSRNTLMAKCLLGAGLAIGVIVDRFLDQSTQSIHQNIISNQNFQSRSHPASLVQQARRALLSEATQNGINYAQFNFQAEVERDKPISSQDLQERWSSFINTHRASIEAERDPVRQARMVVRALDQTFHIGNGGYEETISNMNSYLMGKKGNCEARTWIMVSALREFQIHLEPRYQIGIQDFGHSSSNSQEAHLQVVLFDHQERVVINLLTGDRSSPNYIAAPIYDTRILFWSYLHSDSSQSVFLLGHPASDYLIAPTNHREQLNNPNTNTNGRNLNTNSLSSFPENDSVFEISDINNQSENIQFDDLEGSFFLTADSGLGALSPEELRMHRRFLQEVHSLSDFRLFLQGQLQGGINVSSFWRSTGANIPHEVDMRLDSLQWEYKRRLQEDPFTILSEFLPQEDMKIEVTRARIDPEPRPDLPVYAQIDPRRPEDRLGLMSRPFFTVEVRDRLQRELESRFEQILTLSNTYEFVPISNIRADGANLDQIPVYTNQDQSQNQVYTQAAWRLWELRHVIQNYDALEPNLSLDDSFLRSDRALNFVRQVMLHVPRNLDQADRWGNTNNPAWDAMRTFVIQNMDSESRELYCRSRNAPGNCRNGRHTPGFENFYISRGEARRRNDGSFTWIRNPSGNWGQIFDQIFRQN